MRRRELEALFSFHDVRCQIELNDLLFSVNLCFLRHDNNVTHKNTQNICTQLPTTHTTMENVQNQTKKGVCTERHTHAQSHTYSISMRIYLPLHTCTHTAPGTLLIHLSARRKRVTFGKQTKTIMTWMEREKQCVGGRRDER